MNRWPHQTQAVQDVLAAIQRGDRRICLTSPTGGGKTAIACDLIDHWLSHKLKVALYTNRRLLVEQLTGVLSDHGIPHGIRAAGWYETHEADVQICSIQTEAAGSRKAAKLAGTWNLHNADRVIVDEAHLHLSGEAESILRCHHEYGAAYVGLTATPLGMASLYELLIQAGTTTDLRSCGALVRCLHYGPDEPDLKAWKKERSILENGGDLSENQVKKIIMDRGIFGRVLECFNRLNPTRRPTILFAPGVAESLWFAEQFVASGITAAHVDGDNIWINGEMHRASPDTRRMALEGSRSGRIVVLCNRYVFREGVDAPWLSHGIFATIFGGITSYLQSGGRLLRAYPDLEAVTLQDHGGNWHRHGSLNADRSWQLEYTAATVSGLRADRLRSGEEKEPSRCPQCGLILGGSVCQCGFIISRKSRPVVQSDGSLHEMEGAIYEPRRICQNLNGPALWERMYHRSRSEKGSRTFKAAMGLFCVENYGQWPNPSWPLMPRDRFDFYRLVADVPPERLVPKE